MMYSAEKLTRKQCSEVWSLPVNGGHHCISVCSFPGPQDYRYKHKLLESVGKKVCDLFASRGSSYISKTNMRVVSIFSSDSQHLSK